MAKKKITREDFAGLRLLRPAEGKRVDRMYAQGNDSYNPYGYNPEEYGYIKDGGPLPEVTVYGYYDSGDDGGGWSSGIPPWGEDDNPFIDRDNPGYEGDIWFDIYGEDYYYYNSPYYGVYDTEVGGNHNPQKDGVDITDKNHFYFENTEDNPAFHKQLTKLMESNSVLKELLTYFERGYCALTLKIGAIGTKAGAMTDYDNGTISIIFNDTSINDNGWSYCIDGEDNSGLNWDIIHSNEESLIVVLAHESIHARHFAVFDRYYHEAEKKGGNTWENLYNLLSENRYSQEFIDIFITTDSNNQKAQRDSEGVTTRLDSYIEKYDRYLIEAALDEYRNDFLN